MVGLANLYWNQGRYAEAEPLYLETLETRKRVLGDDHPDTLHSMNNLAIVYLDQGRYAEAEPLHLETLETRKRVLGDDHPNTLASMNNLANLYLNQGRYAEAEPLHLETLETKKRVLGDDHPDTLASMNNLAGLYVSQGRYAEAEPLLLETLETRKRVNGNDHPNTLLSMNNLASLYQRQGRYAEAEPLYLETLKTQKRVLGDDHPDTLRSMNNLANLYLDQGRYAEAEPLYLETLKTQKRVLGDDHPDTLRSMQNLALLYGSQGRSAEAEPLHLETLETRKRVLGDDHPDTLASMNDLAVLYMNQGRYAEAETLCLETIETMRRVLGDDHRDTLSPMNNLAWLQLTREPANSREPHAALKLALEISEKTGYENPGILDTLSLAYHLTGDTAKAIENQKKAIALLPEGESQLRAGMEEALVKFEAALRVETGYSNAVTYNSEYSGTCVGDTAIGNVYNIGRSKSIRQLRAHDSCDPGLLFKAFYGNVEIASGLSEPVLDIGQTPVGAGFGKYVFIWYDPATGIAPFPVPRTQYDGRNLRNGSDQLPGTASFKTEYVHADHLGSTRLVTDEMGEGISNYKYYPFGHEAEAFGGSDVRMKFTGHERDSGLNLDYMLARYCGPGLGRFLSADPVVGKIFQPSSWNRYPYSANNPLKYVDPDGREVELSPGMQSLIAGGSRDVRLGWEAFLSTSAGREYYGRLKGLKKKEYLARVFAASAGPDMMRKGKRLRAYTVATFDETTKLLTGHKIRINFQSLPSPEYFAETFLDEFIHAYRDKFEIYKAIPTDEVGDHLVKDKVLKTFQQEVQKYLKENDLKEKKQRRRYITPLMRLLLGLDDPPRTERR